jgi:hypothetical protein
MRLNDNIVIVLYINELLIILPHFMVLHQTKVLVCRVGKSFLFLTKRTHIQNEKHAYMVINLLKFIRVQNLKNISYIYFIRRIQ